MRYKYLEKNKLNQAVILCGGLGTRLGKITKKTPKPLIKIFILENSLILSQVQKFLHQHIQNKQLNILMQSLEYY